MIRARKPLPPLLSRCPDTRQRPCSIASTCARGREPHAKGRGAEDWSVAPRLIGTQCAGFLALEYVEPGGAERPAHEAPEGLA